MARAHSGPAISSETSSSGCLYVVATPIGNLEDISERTRRILKECDLIACEDTRTTGRLLAHLGIRCPTLSYHDHNEANRAPRLAERIAAGDSLALVSDAGTPGLSDPGFRLVRECRRQGLTVIPIPGPCAMTAALCASGLPMHSFLFAGFLPSKGMARRRFLTTYQDFSYSIIFYESCHRILKFLEDGIAVLGPERVICVARELTKRYETFYVDKAANVITTLQAKPCRGEYVVIVAPKDFKL